jgi:L-threonylcarbamoyladenylate synthase
VSSLILPPEPHAIQSAAEALLAGRLVGLPTETVYGLAGDATNAQAVAAIYAAKGRPAFNPLISHVADLAAAEVEGVFEPLARRLAEAFWPGPLTLVVPRKAGGRVCDLACAGLGTIALRVPGHPVAQAVLAEAGRPLAAPSANRSGRPTPTTAEHVAAELGDAVALILDAGPARVGLESAVVAVQGGQATLLRVGGLERAQIEAVVGGPLLAPGAAERAAPASPGMVLRHYAPDTTLRLNVTSAAPGELHLGFDAVAGTPGFSLSEAGDVVEAAARLFALIRAADALKPTAIAVAPVPLDGLGEAINERLERAAGAR